MYEREKNKPTGGLTRGKCSNKLRGRLLDVLSQYDNGAYCCTLVLLELCPKSIRSVSSYSFPGKVANLLPTCYGETGAMDFFWLYLNWNRNRPINCT